MTVWPRNKKVTSCLSELAKIAKARPGAMTRIIMESDLLCCTLNEVHPESYRLKAENDVAYEFAWQCDDDR